MDYSELKNLMRTYLGNDVDSKELEHLFVDDDPAITYLFDGYIYNGMSHLHKCVILTNKYPKLNDYLEKYLENYNNIDKVTTKYGIYPLHLASLNSRNLSTEKTVEILINAGANVNLQDNCGFTALHHASIKTRNLSTERTVEILINAGTDVNLRDKVGRTALHYASINSRVASTERTVEILILADADVFSLKDNYNETPYNYLTQELKERFQIDLATKTIGIKTGRLTKSAKK